MRYKQYTKCVTPSSHLGLGWYVGGAGFAGVAIAIALIMVGGAIAPAVGAAALMLVVAYCRWWLYDRLVCVGDIECAVGFLHSVEPPEAKSFPEVFDTDFSMNIILAPNLDGVTQQDAENSPLRGRLVTRQPALSSFDFTGYEDVPGALHVEFEGSGIWDLYQDAWQPYLLLLLPRRPVRSL
ncbi:hypothetical protein [Streptomyces sp. NPDC054783]